MTLTSIVTESEIQHPVRNSGRAYHPCCISCHGQHLSSATKWLLHEGSDHVSSCPHSLVPCWAHSKSKKIFSDRQRSQNTLSEGDTFPAPCLIVCKDLCRLMGQLEVRTHQLFINRNYLFRINLI